MQTHLSVWLLLFTHLYLMLLPVASAAPPVSAPAVVAVPEDHMELAASLLEQGDAVSACVEMARHVDAHPEQVGGRRLYAELLLRIGRLELARLQFQQILPQLQQQSTKCREELLHCHTRLMAIAEQSEDEYEARLQRGIGLYYLALKRAELAAAATELSTETILCKAAGELALARLFEPDDARPCWYLYLVWSQLGQSQAAAKHLHLACALAPFSALTAIEQRDLELSCRHHLDMVESQRR